MILVAGGDSFIYGAELKDQIGGPSQSTFPALLAKHQNMEYVCAAWNGNANNAISRMTMRACQEMSKRGQSVFALVMWTFVHRFEFHFNYDTQQEISPWYSINSWSIEEDENNIFKFFKNENKDIQAHMAETLKKDKEIGITDFAKTFYKHVGNNEYYEMYTSLKEILFLQNYLESKNIPYLFIPADISFQEHENYLRRKDGYLSDLHDQINWNNWYMFPKGKEANETRSPRGFYQWAIENKYNVGTTHPLEDAHYDAAELIRGKFDEMVKKIDQ